MLTINSLIHIIYQDGSKGWYMNVSDKPIKILAKTAKEVLKKFPNDKTVENYTMEQSDVIKTYTQHKFKS
jgi:hypothetical protein